MESGALKHGFQCSQEALEATRAARKRFERRVCDYRYAEIEALDKFSDMSWRQDKGQTLADAYGWGASCFCLAWQVPMGP